MFRFRSLSSKLMFIGIVMLTFLAIYTYSDFRFTQHMKGNTTAINLAGQLRFLSFEISWNIQRIEKADQETRKSLIIYLVHQTKMIDWILTDFKNGNRDLNIQPITHNKESIDLFNTMLREWNDVLKPMILRSAELKGDGPEAMELFSRYNFRVYRYVYDRVNDFVKSLEDHAESKIKEFDIFRIYMFGFFFLPVVFVIFYINKSILKPVKRLRKAVEEVEKGNFDVRLDIKTRDEIGDLGNASNRMAQTLKFLFDEKTRHIKEVWALSKSSNILFNISPEEDIYEAICNIAVRDFDLRFVWIGLIEEGSYNIKPVAHSGYEEGYLSHIKVTGDDSLPEMRPSGMALKTKTPRVIHDYESDPAITPWREEALKRGYRSSMAVPIIFSDGKVIGVLKFYSGEPQFFTGERFDILQVFGNHATTAIENMFLIEGLEEKVKERTSKLEIARLEAESANRAKSEFLTNMSHELRTPLNSVMGFSQVMLDGMTGDMTEQQKEFMKDIYNSGKHLLSLIDDILDLSKVEAGKMELELSEFNLRDFIERSIVMFKEKAMKHSIKLKTEVEEGIIENIIADELRIKQVLFNLLGNALKFTP
ncbi:MAG: GAF domain-containing protein, partial [Nitrospirota bacterium]